MSWLHYVLTPDVVGIRLQSGFFEARVLGVFTSTLQLLSHRGLDTVILIGSNDGETQSSAVHQLVDLIAFPRPNARLGVVRYANGFYHPKTIYLCYSNGRQVAYVGSANLTSRGINGLNVEAGVVLDTDEGDPVELLTQIKQAASEWFRSRPVGLFEVQSHDDVRQLEDQGVLTAEPTAQRLYREGAERTVAPLPRRRRLYDLPQVLDHGGDKDDAINDLPQEEPGFDQPVLIAQLAGPGRWSQAAFPEWFVNNFFKVLPNTGDVLRLWPVTRQDGVGPAEEIICGFKKGSKNWYYELGLATRIGAYPQTPNKPIGVFHRVDSQACRYTIVLPDDELYPFLAGFLEDNRYRIGRPKSELARTIVSAEELPNAWFGGWFFET